MKELNFKNVWLIIIFMFNDLFTNRIIILPKDITDDEIAMAVIISLLSVILLIVLLITTAIIIF